MQYLFCPQVLKWGDIATWASATATVLAVVTAGIAITKENRRQRELQIAEWARADARTKEITTRLAATFHKELYRATVELHAALACLLHLDERTVGSFRSAYRSGLDKNVLSMMERFASDLQGFETRDTIALLNAISIWKSVPILSEGVSDGMPDGDLIRLKDSLRNRCEQMIVLYRQLQESLLP